LAYIITGVLVKVLGINSFQHPETLSLLANLGIAFLLFIVGLELNPREVKEIGVSSLIVGGVQVIGTTIIGYFLGRLFGFSIVAALYIGLALSFSSTIITVKILSEKAELNSLYGRLSVGALLFQDLVAMVVLIFLSGFSGGGLTFTSLILTILKAFLFLAIVYFLSRDFLPGVFKKISSDTELLFVGSIAWCLVLAGVARLAGFSLEIGAFLAGLSLATTTYHYQIGAKIKNSLSCKVFPKKN